ncbi:hypothetical protein ACFO5X_06270 [Seohaeicola nanhaiensis]|uniref:Uncharacterized protein n=1 Tax=Seohaeicola nanhaiensis TaxID=1387282 RepID=A0ABV9KDZ8_9RHOB
MHPAAFEEYLAHKARFPGSAWIGFFHRSAQTILVSKEIVAAAEQLALSVAGKGMPDGSDWYFPVLATPPAEEVILVTEFATGSLGVWPIRITQKNGVEVNHFKRGCRSFIGCFRAGESFSSVKVADTSDDKTIRLGQTVWKMAFILSLLNEPRLIRKGSQQGSGSVRRRFERAMNRPSAGWTRVSWRPGSVAESAHGGDATGDRMPLHWCRGHWRRIKNQTKPHENAVWLQQQGSGSWYWYERVSDCWKGHPDFGVKLHHLEPLLNGEKPIVGRELPSAASAARKAMTDAACRSALMAAGFA